MSIEDLKELRGIVNDAARYQMASYPDKSLLRLVDRLDFVIRAKESRQNRLWRKLRSILKGTAK